MKLSVPNPFSILQALVFAAPVALAAAVLVSVIGPQKQERGERLLELAEVDSAEAMRTLFEERGSFWPPQSAVPPFSVKAFPPGLRALEVQTKKQLFLGALLPVVLAENARIRRERERLAFAFAKGWIVPGGRLHRYVAALSARYRIQADPNDPKFQRRLLRRVDEIPPALALAQAANESAWGTSRFAREGNNLFGHWTWDRSRGMRPLRRDAGATHFVRIFPDVRSSVRAYLQNINSGAAYRRLREMRAVMRAAGQPLDPLVLAGGLIKYSERGQAYVRDIRALIRDNNLDALKPGLSLAGGARL